MANKRIKDLSTTAAVTASDDFIAVDGATNGTRKLDAYSPTFGGNLTVTGALLAHQTGTLNMAYEGSSLSQLVAYGADASTYGRANIILRKAGTGVGAVTALALTSTDATLAGNLTVSGTGTSSVAGSLRVSAATAVSKLTVGDTSNTFSAFIFGNNSANGIAFGTGGTGVPVINGYNNTFAATQTIAIQPNGGNLLLGTTTDGGQKLQVAGTAYIGSATTTTNPLTVQGNGPNTTHQAGTSTAAIWNRWLNSAGTRRGYYGYASSGDSTFTIMNEENASFVLGTNNATALTLDSSLNATFAGNVTAIKAGTAFYSIESTVNGALSEVIVKGKNSTGTAREARLGLNKYADDVFSIYDGTTERFRLGLTNGDATFSGTIAIGQYTTAGAPAYAKGKLYFDVTLNKLRVGGATGWETITSV